MNVLTQALKGLAYIAVGMYFTFLVLLLFAAGFVLSLYAHSALEKDSVMKIRVDDPFWLDYDEAARLARRFDTMVDKIEEANWKPDPSSKNINDLMYEITPMFMYEELVNETNAEFETVPVTFADGFKHNHTAGRSDCRTYVLLNARFQNVNSSWFSSGSWPVVLAHEIAHAQQGDACSRQYNSQNLLENSAQIMAWEVMAALGNQGSAISVLSMAVELRGVALSSAAAMATVEDRQDDYDKLLRDIYKGKPSKEAATAKGRRFWADDMDELDNLRMRYSWTPLNMVFKARHEGTIYQLAISNDTHSAKIDDLIYFLEHAEELVDWALEEQQKSQAEN